jgi:hypothetical protein
MMASDHDVPDVESSPGSCIRRPFFGVSLMCAGPGSIRFRRYQMRRDSGSVPRLERAGRPIASAAKHSEQVLLIARARLDEVAANYERWNRNDRLGS